MAMKYIEYIIELHYVTWIIIDNHCCCPSSMFSPPFFEFQSQNMRLVLTKPAGNLPSPTHRWDVTSNVSRGLDSWPATHGMWHCGDGSTMVYTECPWEIDEHSNIIYSYLFSLFHFWWQDMELYDMISWVSHTLLCGRICCEAHQLEGVDFCMVDDIGWRANYCKLNCFVISQWFTHVFPKFI